ncbi:MAG: aldehyde dehydrogenase family protein [Phycisphaeraceae bacterium]|nr:aldehyde dehydrogenase family protein [Phycisphaeraceae bacterium]
MPERLDVLKTYKLFIGGAFPRSESGRSLPIAGGNGKPVAHIAHASRKDLRDAVEAARKAVPGWSGTTAYNRGQVLYRMAEMLEGKRLEFVEALKVSRRVGSGKGGAGGSPAKEVDAAIDRLVCFGGWADKYAQVLGCNNPVAGPFYNFTVPEPTGVVGVVAPKEAPLLGLVSLLAPVICSGNTAVALASEANPLPGAILGEVCATSDVPAGVINILTGHRAELLPHFASHRDIDGLHAAGLSGEEARLLREGVAENVKRVTVRGRTDWFDEAEWHSPWWIEPFVEMKTIWHPSGA